MLAPSPVSAFRMDRGRLPACGDRRESHPKRRSIATFEGWKDRLKQRCLERVRQQREQLIQEIRGLASPSPQAANRKARLSPSPFTPATLRGRGANEGTREGQGEEERETCSASSAMVNQAAMSILQSEMLEMEMQTEAEGEAQEQTDDGDVAEGRRSSMVVDLGRGRELLVGCGAGEEFDGLSSDEYYDLMRYVEEALQEELRAEEERQQLQCLEELDEGELTARADLYDYDSLPADGVAVLCPVCKGSYLMQDQCAQVIQCACGLKIDVQYAGFSLAHLGDRLAATWAEHRERECDAEPAVFVTSEFGVTILCAECSTCQYYGVVM